MQLGISPISNSPKRTQQRQQSFGAYTYTGKLDEIIPILEKAKQRGMEIFTPNEIMQTVREEFPPDEANELREMFADELRKLIQNYLFTKKEKTDIKCTAMISAFGPTIEKVRMIINNATPLPLGMLKGFVSK